MKSKGFTLIELLAVIVILAIIALIAVPSVLNIIEESKESAVKESARNISRAAETYYMQGVMKGGTPDSIDLTSDTLKYNGEKPEKGLLTYDETGRAHVKMYMNGFCVDVDFDNTVNAEKKDKSECKINAVILSLNPMGGNLSEQSKEYDKGDSIGTLPTLEKEGYIFNGWVLSDGTKVTESTKITETMTINASWEAKTYTITLNDGNDEVTDETKVVTFDSAYGELPTPSKTGYIFNGWKLDNGENINSKTIVKIADNHYLYAQWEKIVIDTSNMNLVLSVTGDDCGEYLLHAEIEGANTDTKLTSVKYEIYFNGANQSDFELLDIITMNNADEKFAIDYSHQEDAASFDYFKVIVYTTWDNVILMEETVEYYCFVAGTKVLTENGYTNIEDIKKGDMVYSYNLDTNELELKEVTRTIVSSAKETYKMTIGTEEVEMSVKHELYLIDKGWVRAYDVEVGDKMLDSKGNEIEITNIEYTKYDEAIPTYNLTVDGNHNYFVTNIQVLVHNALSVCD